MMHSTAATRRAAVVFGAFAFYALTVEPAFASSIMAGILCTLMPEAEGLGSALSAFALVSLGIAALLGKASLQMAILIAVGRD